ncbi:MAG: hypothetical protein Q7T01_04065 [bacterium]|nr:hypothetical protein [bacterium]
MTSLMWALAVCCGVALWFFVGAVFGQLAPDLQARISQWCSHTTDRLRGGGRAAFASALVCLRVLDEKVRALWQFGREHLPSDVEAQRDPDAPRQSSARPDMSVPRIVSREEQDDDVPNAFIVLVMTLLFLAAAIGNWFLMRDIAPDLFSLSQDDLTTATGALLLAIASFVIVLGEVGSGFAAKYESRRQKSARMAWFMFAICYLVELAAGARRAISFFDVGAPINGVSPDLPSSNITHAAFWIGFAAGLPWLIFCASYYMEPAYSRWFGPFVRTVASGIGSAILWIVRNIGPATMGLVRVAIVILGVAVLLAATIVLGIGLVVASVFLFVLGAVLYALSFVLEIVIGVLQIVLWCVITVPAEIVGALTRAVRGRRREEAVSNVVDLGGSRTERPPVRRGSGPTGTAALLAACGLAVMQGNCGSGSTSGDYEQAFCANPDMTFETVAEQDLAMVQIPEATFRKIANPDLVAYINDHHQVVQVAHPSVHVCLADLSASVRSEQLRTAVLQHCAEIVSRVSEQQGPETTGVVIPIVDAGVASETPYALIAGERIPTRCAINPPFPELHNLNTTAGPQVKQRKQFFEQVLGCCDQRVTALQTDMVTKRGAVSRTFVTQVITEFRGVSPQRTDIFASIKFADELIGRIEQQQGVHFAQRRISLVSDLEDDANGCTVTEDAVACPETVFAMPAAVCKHRGDTTCQAYQVRQATLGSRQSRTFVRDKLVREQREQAWATFWREAVGVSSSTFTPPPALGQERSGAHPEPSVTFVPSQPRPAPPRAEPEPQQPGCDTSSIVSKYDAMRTRMLSRQAWKAYGDALAACAPATEPWGAIGVSRQVYQEEYVFRFLGNDMVLGGWYGSDAPRAYGSLQRDW